MLELHKACDGNVLLAKRVQGNDIWLIVGVCGCDPHCVCFFVPTEIVGLRRFAGRTNSSVLLTQAELSQDLFG